MKKKQIGLFLLNICFIVLSVKTDAQVTIGSGLRPNKGALLDLKQEGVTTKGLGLPRVLLKEENKLIIGDYVIPNENSAWTLHTGLLVYNLNKCLGKGGDGVYVWDGNLWERLPSRDQYEEEALFQANSYLVMPGTTSIEIPVEKAFRIWEYYGSSEGKNRLPAELVEGDLTPILYWQDAPIILSQSSLSISGNSRTDVIIVALAGGTVEGNAVIALKDGSGNVRWSWHIWVTDDPTIADLNGGGFTWMDRNLGATSAFAGDVGTIGLSYQWGRKDPFPMSQQWSNTEPTLQSFHGELIMVVDKTLTNEFTTQENFKNSIIRPMSFIKKTSTTLGDWYESSTLQEDPWNERWDRTEGGCFYKSPFDPCPKGWKVPTYEYDENGKSKINTSPWEDLFSQTANSENYARTWDDFGVYPLSGYRSYTSANLSGTSSYGYTWSASVSNENSSEFKPYSFYYRSGTNQRSPMDKTWGFSVRCIKE